MSQKYQREEGKTNASKNLPVVSKCLAIVLIPKVGKNSSGDVCENDEADETVVDPTDGNIIQSSEVRKALTPAGYSGKELLQDFKIRNKTCYWNPSLVESIKSLECKGFVEPCTILVTAEDIHLENLRSAWTRRVLQPPAGFLIDRIGDVNGIDMQVIPQTHFIPLPDAVCSIIMDLNMRRIVATLEMVLEKLSLWYKDMTVPSQQLVFDTLGSLIRERKVFHTGSGYFVVTPDTNRLHGSSDSGYIPTNASWLPYHPMYVPVFQGQVAQQPMLLPSKSHMRSISCQVTTIEETSEEEDVKERKKTHERLGKVGYDTKSSRSDSLKRREGKDDLKSSNNVKRDNKVVVDNGAELKRTSSLKGKNDKAKAATELNPKTSSANKVKEKGEKTSIFSKLFSRKKKHKDKDKALMPPPPPPPPRAPVATPSSDSVSEGKGEKEYGTFSAQFPPPEWVWYHQQLEKQKRTETWICQQSTKVVSHTQSVKVTSRPPTGIRQLAPVDYHQHGTEKALRPVNPETLDYMAMNPGGHKDGVASNSVHKVTSGDFAKPHPIRADRFYHSLRNPSGVKHHMHQRKSREFEQLHEDRKQSDYAVIDQDDASTLHESNVIRSVSALSPVAHLSDESTYAKLVEPNLGPLHSTPRYEEQTERATHRTDGLESKDKVYASSDYSQRRKSHRTRRRPHRMYTYYDGQGDDISYEYKGRLPNKNSSRTQSKDSGVNCVGLAMPENKDKRQPGVPVYETAPGKNVARVYPGRNHPGTEPAAAGNHVHFMVNGTTAGEATNAYFHSTADSATNSLIYQSDMTNPAYNSVVYCSSITDMPAGSSVLYHTITGSSLESAEMHLHHNSLQSAFYSETGMDLISLNAMACKSEIDRIASQDVVELHNAVDTLVVDIVGLVTEDASEASEAVSKQVKLKDGQEELLNTNNRDCKYEDGQQTSEATEGRNSKKKFSEGNEQIVSDAETGLDAETKQVLEDGRPGNACGGSDTNTEARTLAAADCTVTAQNAVLSSENCVLDSGFNSPINVEKPSDQVAASSPSNSTSENSDALSSHDSNSHRSSDSSSHTHQSSSAGSHDQHSDVYMATGSDHHSSSANEHAEEQLSNNLSDLPKLFPAVKQSSSLNSIKSFSHVQQSQPTSQYSYQHLQQSQLLSQHSYQHHLQHPHYHSQQLNQNVASIYHTAAKIVPHPDAYNNNTASIMYIEQNHHFGMPLQGHILAQQGHMLVQHGHMLAQQRSQHKHPKRERPHSVDLWKSSTPSELHKFEEEQLSKKYGEFEVMGVL